MSLQIGKYPLGDTYFDIPEFVNLYKTREKFRKRLSKTNRSNYYNAFNVFLDFFISYADGHICGISHELAANKIFGNTRRQTKNVCCAKLLAAKLYAEEIKTRVCNESMMDNVDDLVTNLLSEFEDVIILFEKILHRNNVNAKVYVGSNSPFSLSDIVSAANQLMFSYATKSMITFDYSNTQPYVIVQVRQLIENIVFRAIGVESITNRNGRIANGIITETLDFLIDTHEATNFSISFPVSPRTLRDIYKWSCSFVHKSIVSLGYEIYYAFFLTSKLIEQPLTPIRIYDGSYQLKYEYGEIKINHYNDLKVEYENRISPKGARNIEWLPIENVGAYILSL